MLGSRCSRQEERGSSGVAPTPSTSSPSTMSHGSSSLPGSARGTPAVPAQPLRLASSSSNSAWYSSGRLRGPGSRRSFAVEGGMDESSEASPGTQKASEADGWCEENRSADLRASPAYATTSTPWTSTNRELYVRLPCPSVPTSCSKVLADARYFTRWRVAQTSHTVLLALFLGEALDVAGEVHPDVRSGLAWA
jgi:hypothetical protein